MGNSYKSVLVISDIHAPFQHYDTIKFLRALKRKYRPDKVVCTGDEADKQAIKFHQTDSDLFSAGDELKKTTQYLHGLYDVFPIMDILESNHGSLHLRKAKANGIPIHYMKDYNEIYDLPKTWKWYHELVLKLSDGQKVYFCHGKIKDSAKLSQQMGMNVCQGHYHESFKIEYWSNPDNLFWGLNVGCLIDNKSMAFAYNKVFPKRPIIGTAIILDGLPKLLPMILNGRGRWTGYIP